MSVWTTKSLDRDREYIVIRHKLRGLNTTIHGVTFRQGYAVVEKGSKVLQNLRRVRPNPVSQEFPLVHLKKLQFITRTADVDRIFGRDVYTQYCEELRSYLENREENEHKASNKCQYKLDNGNYCKQLAHDFSPSKYCTQHILNDPMLEELEIEVPRMIFGKENKKKFKEEVIEKLRKLKSENKF